LLFGNSHASARCHTTTVAGPHRFRHIFLTGMAASVYGLIVFFPRGFGAPNAWFSPARNAANTPWHWPDLPMSRLSTTPTRRTERFRILGFVAREVRPWEGLFALIALVIVACAVAASWPDAAPRLSGEQSGSSSFERGWRKTVDGWERIMPGSGDAPSAAWCEQLRRLHPLLLALVQVLWSAGAVFVSAITRPHAAEKDGTHSRPSRQRHPDPLVAAT